MIRFAVDRMLGKLAKWLRILGYDTFYDNGLPFEKLVDRSLADGRVLITRNSKIREYVESGSFVLLQSELLDDQLRCLVEKFSLDIESYLFTRCVHCNVEVSVVDKKNVQDVVPPMSYEGCSQFCQCPSCHKVYWYGAHVHNTLKRLRRVFPDVTP